MKKQSSVLICFLFAFLFGCSSIKSEIIPNKKINPDYNELKNDFKINTDWICENNTSIKTFELYQNKTNQSIYIQEIKNSKNKNDLVLYYLKSDSKDFNLIAYAYSFEKRILSYKELSSIHWINCQLVCKDEQLKETILKLWDKKLPGK